MSEERQLELNTAQLEEQTARSVDAIRAAVPTGIGCKHCTQCGEQIPDARRWGGYRICVECAQLNEHMKKRYGRMP